MTIPRRSLGATGIEVSALGLGAGPLGDMRIEEAHARALVDAALDAGLTTFDTAPSYGASEERLGRALAGRRRELTIVTKGGYGVPGVQDWTGEVIRLGIEQALERLAVDVIDVFLLHSCDLGTLERGDVIDALERAKQAGKIRAAGYSGENEALEWAVRSGRFDVVECSVNPFDRASLPAAVASAAGRGLGVLAKRPLANACWRFDETPEPPDVRAYWERARTMAFDPAPLEWSELALRFAAFAPGVSAALLGTSSVAHLGSAVAALGRGPLDDDARARLDDAWKMHATPEWRGVV